MTALRTAARAAALALALAGPAAADPQADARAIVEATLTVDMLRGTMAAMGPLIAQAVQQQLQANGIAVSDPDRFVGLIAEEFEGAFLDEMRLRLTEVYAGAFTPDELAAIAAFYATPAGQAMLEKTPALMQTGSQIGQEVGAIAFRGASRRLADRMEAEGLSFSDDRSTTQRLIDMLRR